jgi:RNA polymerase sigma-70 factor (ECF subfamily)
MVNPEKKDRAAFRDMFLHYYPKVKGFLVCLLKDETAAEDLAQDVFVALWEKREVFPDIRSMDAYIFRMAKNTFLNHVKRNAYHDRYVDEQKEHVSLSITDSGEEALYAREKQLLIELIVENMPAQRRCIFRMSRGEGMKKEDIAKRLGLSKKTVENHINLALKELRKVIMLGIMIFCQFGIECTSTLVCLIM